MKGNDGKLKRFDRRVRLVRSWRGAAFGLMIGGAACAIWAALDWFRIIYTEWSWMGWVLLVSVVLGAVRGYFARIPADALADSIDRRGGLQDRLKTSSEVSSNNEFASALQEDANAKVESLRPKELYPLRMGRNQWGALSVTGLAAMIFLLGNTPVLQSPEERRDREELKKMGQAVERVVKPLTEPDQRGVNTDAERRMAEEFRNLQRDLEKSKLNKEEALQAMNELAKQSQDIVKERAKITSENLEKAESALDKLQRAELERNGMEMNPETMKALKELQESQRQSGESQKTFEETLQQLNEKQAAQEMQKQALEQKHAELKSQLENVESQLQNSNLSDEQRQALEKLSKQLAETMKKLENEMAELQKAIDEIMKSKEIQELLRKINEHPTMKELQELAEKLASEAKMAESGEMPELTPEDIAQMKEQLKEAEAKLKELAEQLQDPEALEEFMQQLKEALENMEQLELKAGACMACLSLFNLPIPGMGGVGSPEDFMSHDTGKINKNEAGKEGQGQTKLTSIKGERQKDGDETYIEIKGPTAVGNRSGVKYTKVLPSYQKKAEEAMKKKRIPRRHEKRVKEYFESLSKGK